MNVPTKQQLRDEIKQLREDLFQCIEHIEDRDFVFPILVRNMWYYDWKLAEDTIKDLYRHAYGGNIEPTTFKGILATIETN